MKHLGNKPPGYRKEHAFAMMPRMGSSSLFTSHINKLAFYVPGGGETMWPQFSLVSGSIGEQGDRGLPAYHNPGNNGYHTST